MVFKGYHEIIELHNRIMELKNKLLPMELKNKVLPTTK